MTDITKGLAVLAKAQAEVSRQEAEEERARMQQYRERLAAAELEKRRAVFSDSLQELRIDKGTLEEALSHYASQCEKQAHPSARLGAALYGDGNIKPFTPELAKIARQKALDALDVLNPGHRAIQVEKAETEARAHHVHVTAHQKRCTHAEPLGPPISTWRLLNVTVEGSVRQRCAQCHAVRQLDDTPMTFASTAHELYRSDEQVSVGGKPIGYSERSRAAGMTAAEVLARARLFGMEQFHVMGVPVTESQYLQSVASYDPGSGESVGVALVQRDSGGEVINVVRIENLAPMAACPHRIGQMHRFGQRECPDCGPL